MKMFSKLLITLLFSVFSTLTFAQTFPSSQAVVPGCGDKKIKWDVAADRSKHPIAAPEPGKALVYFLQDDTNFQVTPRPTTRFGLNRSWVGATPANAYFYVSVDPGEQHLSVPVGNCGHRPDILLPLITSWLQPINHIFLLPGIYISTSTMGLPA
jgi:hypothetical protein